MATTVTNNTLSTDHQQVKNETQGWGSWLASFVYPQPTALDGSRVQSVKFIFENRDALIEALKDFPFAPKELNAETLEAFIKQFNCANPQSPIDPEKNLLEELQRAKQSLENAVDDFVMVKLSPGFQLRITNPTQLEEDEAAIRKELAPFYDHPESITNEDVEAYVTLLNETYPEYAIDPEKSLLDEIRRTKMAMIERGEEGFKNGVNWYAFFSEDAMHTMVKIHTYQTDRAGFAEDTHYQRKMLSSFKFFHE
ncbi:MAG: hypothetical protein H7A38_02055 [Chlamydiales bacterium]|nr:hypothetical protein [Chlamydiales bacterium]